MKKEKAIISKIEMFDALMDNIPDSIYFKDLKSRFIGINKAVAERLKIKNSEEALGKTDYDFFTKEHADKAFLEEQNIIKSNTPFIESEEKETYEGGIDKWVSTIKMPLYDEKRKIFGTFGISRDITERKAAEEEIKSLAKFPEENPNLVGRIDYHGKILYCNHVCKRIFKDNNTIPNKLQDAVKKIATEKISTSEGIEIEIGDRIFLFNFAPIKEKDYINFYGTDITDRKILEEELKESRIRFDIAIEASQIGIWELDLIRDTSVRNLIHDQIFGYKEKIAEWGAKIFFKHISPEDKPSVQAAFDEAMKVGKLYFECGILWPNKQVHWITASGKVIRNGDGKPEKILGTVIDITERKKAENLLAESEEKFRILFNTSAEGILITEIGTQKIKYANPSICKMLGYTEKELTAMDIAAIHSKEDLQGIFTKFKNQINIRETEILLLRKDGTNFYAAINGVIITINAQKYCTGFFHDISDRKKTEEAILFLSYHDQLTGLYNRRFFEEEKKRLDTKRQLPASIIMADVDGLKDLNDIYGHVKGDELLISTSEIIKNSCRKEDIIARHGGDEFIIFLPKTKEADALDVIDRIRKASKIKKLDDKINISISLGLATKNDLNEDMDHIIEQADKNMYADKASKKSDF